MAELISQGAEAKLFMDGNFVIKERTAKNYRIRQIDEKIRKLRTRREINILERASKIIHVPKIHKGSSEKEFKIVMDYIKGRKLSASLDSFPEKKRNEICRLIGESVAALHNNNIIHGDLTTSNMIIGDKLYFIDFGLSFVDPKTEHKAVDLHLLKQALESRHYEHYATSFNAVLEGYKNISKEHKHILERLNKVEGRGKYKSKKRSKALERH